MQKHSQELGVKGMWKQAGQCVHEWKHRISTGSESEDIKMCEVYTRIGIRVGVWHMLSMVFDEVHVWCSVWGLLGFFSRWIGKGVMDAEGLVDSRDMQY